MPDIDIGPVSGGSRSLRGYLATPAAAGPWPGVVLIHEAYGVTSVLRRQVDRMAAAGYVSFAPDLYSDGGIGCVVATFRAMLTGRGKAIADIDAAGDYLREREDCTGKVGTIGFCMGGGFALVTATRGFDAASANYGMVPRHAEHALAGACPIVGSYGGKDLMMPGMAPRLERALTELDIAHDVKVYPNAGHSFLNDDFVGPAATHPIQRIANVAPIPEVAADAWRRIETFFGEHLAN